MAAQTLKAIAESNPEVQRILASGANHVTATRKVNALFSAETFHTSEAAVRRYRSAYPPAPAQAPEAVAPEQDYDGLEERFEDLLRKHNATLRKLSDAKAKKEELVTAVYDAAAQAAAALNLPATPKPVLSKSASRRSPEVAVAVLSDWQLAKVTPTYNSAVCEERIEQYAKDFLKVVDIQRADHPVKDLHVWALGDLIEGELIFPGQSFLVDASLYRQVVVDGPRILGNFLRTMAANFETVTFHGVIGNHGRLGGRASRDMDPESNGDRMLYKIVQQLLANERRISWSIPDGAGERNWYDIATIGKYSSLLIHGDQFRGTSGLPWYGLQKKVGGWRMGAISEHFDDVFFGHYHQPTRVTLNTVTARCSGSTESANTYAQEQMAAVGFPSQPAMFVHPGQGIVTAEYTIWLDGGPHGNQQATK